MSTVIKVEGLGKLYQLGLKEAMRDSLREVIVDALKAPFRRLSSLRGNGGNTHDYFWALKDVSLEVQEGEVLGIIGRNGAGKSTLLKLISRITEPTDGKIKIRGRVSSLLEVGTGFHPELTGGENIYLNGSILGMSRAEINRKYEEIVEFAEIGRFIDTPVKRYSSGMYVRLAFAVAAHLEPEILIVDEVLAVGDAAFQKKCMRKMSTVAREGRTVLFVSHNMPSVQHLTTRCLLLERGRLEMNGPTREVVDRYMGDALKTDTQPVVELREHSGRQVGASPSLNRIWITDNEDNIITTAPMGGEINIHVEYEVEGTVRQPIVGLVFETIYGNRVFNVNNRTAPGARVLDAPPRGVLSFNVPKLPLTAGDYFISVAFARSAERDIDWVERAYRLVVVPADVYGTGNIPEGCMGVLYGQWKFDPVETSL